MGDQLSKCCEPCCSPLGPISSLADSVRLPQSPLESRQAAQAREAQTLKAICELEQVQSKMTTRRLRLEELSAALIKQTILTLSGYAHYFMFFTSRFSSRYSSGTRPRRTNNGENFLMPCLLFNVQNSSGLMRLFSPGLPHFWHKCCGIRVYHQA